MLSYVIVPLCDKVGRGADDNWCYLCHCSWCCDAIAYSIFWWYGRFFHSVRHDCIQVSINIASVLVQLTVLNSEVIVPHRIIWSWYSGRWVGCYTWYSEEGTERAGARPGLSSLYRMQQPTHQRPVYPSPLLCGFNVAIKGLNYYCVMTIMVWHHVTCRVAAVDNSRCRWQL